MPGEPPAGVGATAIGTARLRAAERRRDDRLFEDPYAEVFVAASDVAPERQRGESMSGAWGTMLGFIPVRVRFFDDWVMDAAAAGLRQFVALGAGLDMRAFRLPWPEGTTVFEVDLTEMFAFKERVIADEGWEPGCQRVPVAADLSGDWTEDLTDAGFDRNEPTAWLLEGLLVYLSRDDNERLLEAVGRSSSPKSRIALGHLSKTRIDELRAGMGDRAGVGAMWQFGLEEDPAAWLARYGWRATVFDPGERATHYGRKLPEERRAGSSWLITAQR